VRDRSADSAAGGDGRPPEPSRDSVAPLLEAWHAGCIESVEPPSGKECQMRDLVRQVMDNARRSGDRIGVDGQPDALTMIAVEAIRVARVATSLHLADSAWPLAAERQPDRTCVTREPAQ